MKNNYQKLSGFILKILALVFMTFDHIGVFLGMYAKNPVFSDPMYMTSYVFRCVGRLAFPLFILLLVEGIRHTKNIKYYLLRVGILTTIVMISQIIIYYCIDSAIDKALSPLIDLSLALVTLALLKRKDKYSYFAIIPIAFAFLTAGVQVYELINSISVKWLPFYIRPGYSLLGLGLALAFYYSYKWADIRIAKFSIDQEYVKTTPYYRSLVSLFQVASLLLINILIFALSYVSVNGNNVLDLYVSSVQTWSIVAGIFILMYNGQRGYNKKWFQFGSYAYFPVHIIIIYLIFLLIFK